MTVAELEGDSAIEVVGTEGQVEGTGTGTEVIEEPIIQSDSEGDSTDDVSTSDDPADDTAVLKYGDLDVTVDIPDDITEAFKSHDLDARALANELYGSKDFTLGAESRKKLDAIYGKSIVDSYLNGLKASNDAMLAAHKGQIESAKKADEEIWNKALEVVGGEEGWNKLEAYALAKLSDDELNEFNAIMQSGSSYAQKLALQDLLSREAKDNGVEELDLVEGNAAVNSEKSYLTKAEYLELFRSGEYRKGPAKYDKLRAKGAELGY